MIFSLVHFSDIHFKVGHNVILNRADKLCNSIINKVIGSDSVIILVSGDIAFSGSQDEYRIAIKFFLDLFDEIKRQTNIDSKYLFIPGNHDCYFEKDNEEIRQLIIEKFAKDGFGELSDAYISKCCEPQKCFFEFVKEINELTNEHSNSPDVILDHKLTQVITTKIGDKTIKFNLFNTSWISSLRERQGYIRFPIEYIESKIPTIDAVLSISVLHHPLNWHTPVYSKPFLQYLHKTSDIIFTGHEHISDAKKISGLDDDFSSIQIESPALQETDKVDSAFNILAFNLDSNEFQITDFVYDKVGQNKKYIAKEETEWLRIDKSKKLKTRDFRIKESFRNKLEDPGTKYTHSTADNIILSDLYVSPYLQVIEVEEKLKPKLTSFEAADVALDLQIEDENYFKIILGPESSGKTTVIKNQFYKFYETGFVPIYLSFDQITGVDIYKIKKIIEKNFINQYDEVDSDFSSIDFNRIVILLDDLHSFRKTEAKIIFLRNLTKLFSKIIITGSELMLFESFKDKKGQTLDPYEKFEWYMLKEFNPSLRNQLIMKWYRLGRDYMDREERNEFFRRVDHAKSNIDSIIGKNFVPAHPVYILAILQGLESGDTNSTNKHHAYYYEMLITNSLKKVLSDKDDIGFYMTLGTEYFYFLFQEKIRFRPISIDDFNVFLESHKKEYKLSKLNNQVAFNVLLESRILRIDSDGNVSIAYKYLYYYFVARFFAENLDDDKIREQIDLMVERVYRDEFSNIIIFLIHLARNNYVINKLIEKSKSIFPSVQPCKLEGDIDFINKLQTTLPDEVLKAVNIEESREEQLRNEDFNEESEVKFEDENLRENYDLDEDITKLDYLAVITRAVRTIDILGQLTKKYWGELKGGYKYDLAEETFLLGLRVLNQHFALIDKSGKSLVESIRKVLLRKYKVEDLTSSDIDAVSGNFIFSLCATSTFAILKRIANAIGSEKLYDTYLEIQEAHPYNSVSITNTAIKLDHYSVFPFVDLDKLKSDNEKNILGLVIIRKFIVEHLYMYDLGYEKMQQICDKYGIKMEEQRYISGSSQIKKS